MCQLLLLIGTVNITQILCLTVKPLAVKDGICFMTIATRAGWSSVLWGWLSCCSVTKSCLTWWPHGLQHARLPLSLTVMSWENNVFWEVGWQAAQAQPQKRARPGPRIWGCCHSFPLRYTSHLQTCLSRAQSASFVSSSSRGAVCLQWVTA